MVNISQYVTQVSSQSIGLQESGGNGYIGNQALGELGQVIGGNIDKSLKIDEQSLVNKQQANIASANLVTKRMLEADEKRNAQLQQTQNLALLGTFAESERTLRAKLNEEQTNAENGADGFVKKYSQIVDDHFSETYKNLPPERRAFLEPKIFDLSNSLKNSAQEFETKERTSNALNGAQNYLTVQLDKVNSDPNSVTMAKDNVDMIVSELPTTPEQKRQIKMDSYNKIDEQHLEFFSTNNPVEFLNNYGGIAQNNNASFDSIMPSIFKTEGGYAAKDGRSNAPVIYGMNKKYNPDLYDKIKTLYDAGKIEEAKNVAKQGYKERYWDAINADSLPEDIRHMAFDTAINQGVDVAKDLINQSGGDVAKFAELRIAKYEKLNQPENIKSWKNRTNEILSQALQKSSTSPDLPTNPAQRKYVMQAQSTLVRIEKQKASFLRSQEAIKNAEKKPETDRLKYLASQGKVSPEAVDLLVQSEEIDYGQANAILKPAKTYGKEQASLQAEARMQDMYSLREAALNGGIGRKEVMDSNVLTSQEKLFILPSVATFEGMQEKALKLKSDAENKAKKEQNAQLEKSVNDNKLGLEGISLLNETGRIDTETYNKLFTKIKTRDKQKQEKIIIEQNFKTGFAGTPEHTKAVNSVFSDIAPTIFDNKIPVPERLNQTIDFLQQSKNVMPDSLKSRLNIMTKTKTPEDLQYLSGIYEYSKLTENRMLLAQIPDDAKAQASIYSTYRSIGLSPEQAHVNTQEDLKIDDATIVSRKKQATDYIKEQSKNQSFLSVAGDALDSYFSDDFEFSNIDTISPAYASANRDLQDLYTTFFVKTGNEETAKELAADGLSHIYRKFNGEFMKNAPNAITDYDEDLINQDIQDALSDEVSLKLLEKQQITPESVKIMSDMQTEKDVKTGSDIRYPIVDENYMPIRDNRGNPIYYKMSYRNLNQKLMESEKSEKPQNNPLTFYEK